MVRFIKRFVEKHTSFFHFCVFGACGVFIDADHVLACILGWPSKDGRAFHLPIFFICGVCICVIVAFVGRLLVRMVLSYRNEKDVQNIGID